MNMVINYAAFGILTVLWLGFGAVLLFDRSMLDAIWQGLRGLPFFLQIILGLLMLPVALGLWIWESELPLLLRLVLVVGLSVATVYLFLPRAPQSQVEMQMQEDEQ